MTEQVTIIQPRSGWQGLNFLELWRYRELLQTFVWRDIKVRYKQTVIGILWAVLQPLLMMGLFTIFFGVLAKVPSNGTPYPVFVYSGLLFWNYFSSALSSSSGSLIENENMVKKIYFPRLVLPLAATVTPAVDFIISFVILLGLQLVFHQPIHLTEILIVPLLLCLTFVIASGLGMFLSAVNIRYRDIRYALPFFIQTLLFATPVIYPASIVPQRFQWILALNPMSGVIEAGRSAVLHTPFHWLHLQIAIGIALVVFTFGAAYFRRTESIFADVA